MTLSSKLETCCNPRKWDLAHPILILGTSGRALAQSAAAGGYRVLVADCYADRETRQVASAWVQIPPGADDEHWRQRIAQLIRTETNPVGLVFGSGFENRPEFMEELTQWGVLLGNRPHCVRLLNDPRRFFSLLWKLAIPAPEIRFSPPDPTHGWLRKAIGGTGGHHVLPMTKALIHGKRVRWQEMRPESQKRRASTSPPYYYQRKLEGQPGSVLFLANSKETQILGYNHLWTAATRAAPYRYGGVATPLNLTPSAATFLQSYLRTIVTATGLRGLNGLDFIQEPGGIQVLEINPRPPASLDLYHDLFNPFDAHVKACLEVPLSFRVTSITTTRAFSILYAPYPLQIPPHMVWPTFCYDCPVANLKIEREEPICSIHARGANIEECRQLIRRRQQQVLKLLSPNKTPA
ncbi:ATP-grasp domain-containing protein [Nitrosococcus wardiae]|uniref:ATP-grasp domain-containing protein n=1 Tax=Nitrosococcus wardiae TaxID=1814290 RepID=A0A4V1AVP8_9GAMM|nr:ATP-grasp domain-containing protein [Nitrosococcus wardiae]QBQ53885.1 ATP-grasp domain-containing protein [Nitrosococcus wardiae]